MRSITCHLVYLISSFVSPANSVHRSRSFPMRNRDPSIYIRGFAVRASELSENLARFQELGLEEREGRILFFVLLTRRSHKDRGTVDERDQFRGPHAIYYVTRCGSFQKTSQRKRTAERNEQRIREGRRRERERERGGEGERGERGRERHGARCSIRHWSGERSSERSSLADLLWLGNCMCSRSASQSATAPGFSGLRGHAALSHFALVSTESRLHKCSREVWVEGTKKRFDGAVNPLRTIHQRAGDCVVSVEDYYETCYLRDANIFHKRTTREIPLLTMR